MPHPTRRLRWKLLLTLALSLTACGKDPSAGLPPAGPVDVATVKVEARSVPLFTELPGRTAAFRTAEVRPQVSGIIQKRLFQEGSEVQAGQQLYQIDPATYQAALDSARADLAKAQANLRSVEAKAARYADLVGIKAVSRQDYDDARASLDQARAQIMAGEAEVETARINLAYTHVYAPISGRIGRSAVTEGALVTANQTTALATVTQLDPIYVDVSQSSSELMRMRHSIAASQGEPLKVTVKLDGNTEYDLPGRLEFAEVTVDRSTGAVQVRALFPNPRHELYPGLFVRARITLGARPDAILVPQRALVRNADGSTIVWVVGADAKATPRPVAADEAVGTDWLVSSGLAVGETIVVAGIQKLRPGVPVRLAPATAASAPVPAPQS